MKMLIYTLFPVTWVQSIITWAILEIPEVNWISPAARVKKNFWIKQIIYQVLFSIMVGSLTFKFNRHLMSVSDARYRRNYTAAMATMAKGLTFTCAREMRKQKGTLSIAQTWLAIGRGPYVWLLAHLTICAASF